MSRAIAAKYTPFYRHQHHNEYLPVVKRQWTNAMGTMVLAANEYGLTDLTFLPQNEEWPTRNITLMDGLPATKNLAEQHIDQAVKQIELYLNGELNEFSVPLSPVGTEFQHQVWQALLALPFGTACSYSDIAKQIERPKAVRAVGSANGANHIALLIPCHRVIGKSGALTGYAYGVEIKRRLLMIEAAI
ncbi:methylated-DNA--[protein]-cysteine S-methyltransferase [Shewanella colwelliana]|uniref:methylated-DNA--[protein]-cysteine S-methyltransferase n=1 Tax=Shewanella colwelliana TaxID=23 RepID=UPI00299E2911|nr:methylated-DNA--[protein]-cysteine S-methyltransferase [Shewanella colwelliana]MDX1282430.1 methylated-DNA--[protein]-cysteine S-methyltransferase [Shewanella colwelliana]